MITSHSPHPRTAKALHRGNTTANNDEGVHSSSGNNVHYATCHKKNKYETAGALPADETMSDDIPCFTSSVDIKRPGVVGGNSTVLSTCLINPL